MQTMLEYLIHIPDFKLYSRPNDYPMIEADGVKYICVLGLTEVGLMDAYINIQSTRTARELVKQAKITLE